MSSPIATPLPGADAVARLLLHLESTPAAHLTATGLGVRLAGGQVVNRVIVSLGDGGREVLDAGEARLAARCLRDDFAGIARCQAWAEQLEAAADDAEQRAFWAIAGLTERPMALIRAPELAAGDVGRITATPGKFVQGSGVDHQLISGTTQVLPHQPADHVGPGGVREGAMQRVGELSGYLRRRTPLVVPAHGAEDGQLNNAQVLERDQPRQVVGFQAVDLGALHGADLPPDARRRPDPLSTVVSLWAIAASIGFVAGAVGWVLGRHGIAL